MRLIDVVNTPADSSKKLVAVFCQCEGKTKCLPEDRKRIQFGSKVSTTFAEGASEQKKDAYLARHKVNEDWTKVNAGALSRWILWSAKSIKQGIANFKKNVRSC
jgi:hypothetical protein